MEVFAEVHFVRLKLGRSTSDVADRLAIVNLFGSYAYTYDENQLDEFRALFRSRTAARPLPT